MLETGLVLGMTATHLGVPLADLVAWGLIIAFMAAPVSLDVARRQRLMKAAEQQEPPKQGVAVPLVAKHRQPEATRELMAVVPAALRLSAAEQWQAVSRLVSSGTERAMAVARDQQTISRELDSLDFSLENLRRELASVMTLPALPCAEVVPVRVASRPHALAA